MPNSYISSTLFLAEHPIFKHIASLFKSLQDGSENSEAIYIVCERKEDLIAVRSQIYHTLLSCGLVEPEEIIDGITMLTLDNLVSKMISSLSNSSPGILSISQIENFQLPFLSVVEQEQLIKLILIQFGYFDADALPIAKQILALVDVVWPPDESFFQLLCDTQDRAFVKTVFDITEHSLKKILATFQATQNVLASYTRLQTFVSTYLEHDFLDHLQAAQNSAIEKFVFPMQILKSPIIWFSAPEYQTETVLYKPGNYQATLVDAVADVIQRAKVIMQKDDFCYARTILDTTSNLDHENIRCSISSNLQQYYEKTAAAIEENRDKNEVFFLLGDFNPGSFRSVQPDASGSYRLQKRWLDYYLTHRDNSTLPTEGSNLSAIYFALDSLYDDYQNAAQRLIPFSSFLKKMSADYQLPNIDFERYNTDIFYQSVQSETILLSHPDSPSHATLLTKADRALSYFAHPESPEQIVVFGRVHGKTSPSFNVKILNDAIFLLKRRGVVIELIASDIMYRGFWAWLLSQNKLYLFLLPNQQSFEEIPESLRRQKFKHVTYDPYKTPPHVLETTLAAVGQDFTRPSWYSDFSWRMENTKTPIVSASQFETYVECPFRFYLNHLLKIESQTIDGYGPQPLRTGIDAHALAEKVISRFRVIATVSTDDLSYVVDRLKTILTDVDLYRSQSATPYVEQLNRLFFKEASSLQSASKNHLIELFTELATIIYSEHADESPLQKILRSELLKRIFKRLIDIEDFLKKQPVKTIPAFCEFSQSLKLGPLSISCRLDRVDKDENNNFHILDYKTSKIVASQKMTIFPNERNSTTKLSTQGAVYVLAFLANRDETDEQKPQVLSFSEIRLKSLNDDAETSFLRNDFPNAISESCETATLLREQFIPFADALWQGKFAARPMEKSVCYFCEHRKICPTGIESIS